MADLSLPADVVSAAARALHDDENGCDKYVSECRRWEFAEDHRAYYEAQAQSALTAALRLALGCQTCRVPDGHPVHDSMRRLGGAVGAIGAQGVATALCPNNCINGIDPNLSLRVNEDGRVVVERSERVGSRRQLLSDDLGAQHLRECSGCSASVHGAVSTRTALFTHTEVTR